MLYLSNTIDVSGRKYWVNVLLRKFWCYHHKNLINKTVSMKPISPVKEEQFDFLYWLHTLQASLWSIHPLFLESKTS